ncbi:tRNA (guanosine(37)-N1)-methyltransferase TrmD [Candidatus Shikimatogenerans bostrichidophilus]|uniref:tRNA (guanosine(37)-N1)-methyltransferase TrmD n=1 Tax=Candidatus Shikimatogenerans bostrichidophilus TaxID=2943807 RepID=UPI002967030A
MFINIITLFPQFWINFLSYPIIKKAIKKKILKFKIHNLKNYVIGNKIDDYPYGGGHGMILKIEPIYNCINKLNINFNEIIFLTPDAKLFNQQIAIKLSKLNNILFICGHYKGIDQRIRDFIITKEYSIGNYVLSNGEISTLVVIDSIIRLIPGVLGNIKSAFTDSFYKNNYDYEYPLYTRPYKFKNMKVPNILLSGNHKNIIKWRKLNQFIKKIKYL